MSRSESSQFQALGAGTAPGARSGRGARLGALLEEEGDVEGPEGSGGLVLMDESDAGIGSSLAQQQQRDKRARASRSGTDVLVSAGLCLCQCVRTGRCEGGCLERAVERNGLAQEGWGGEQVRVRA